MRLGFLKFILIAMFSLFATASFADDDKGGDKGGAGDKGGEGGGAGDKKPEGVYLSRKEYDELVASQKKKEDDKGGGDGDPLRDKVKKEREEREKAETDTKTLESVISYTMGLDDFVKKNSDLLPSEIAAIIKTANAETYETQTAKAAAVKKSIIDCYFAVQANVDCLTDSQKRDLADYQKLTTVARADKAATIYANIFEPCLEMNRRLKKAEELNRGQNGIPSTGSEAAHRDKMVAASMKKYFPGK